MTEREKELRHMAQMEGNYQLEDHDFMGVLETQGEYGLELTDDEARYVHHLITNAWAGLPSTPIEEYTA